MKKRMFFPARGAWLAGLLFLHSVGSAEACEYADPPPPDPEDPTELVQTKIHRLGPLSQDSASVMAARLTGPRFDGSKRYLHFIVRLADYFESEEEALGHSTSERILAGLPLRITLANGDTVELFARSDGRSQLIFNQPGEYYNSSDQYRITTMILGQYWLDKESIAELKSQPAVSLELTTESGRHLIKIDPKAADRIRFVVGCV